jgi:MraZ protein
MFIGEYQHTIDGKGRMAMPAKFRPRLGSGAIITRGLDRCLFVFTDSEWEALAKKIMELSLLKSDSRAFARFTMAGASDVEFDSQGRILIPSSLREYAGLKKEAVVTGVYQRIEIWDVAAWKDYRAKTEKNSDAIAEKLGEAGL